MVMSSRSEVTERFGRCENCGYPTATMKAKDLVGAFLGEPVYDDVWLCQLCIDTMDLRRGMEKDKTMKLMLYLANAILDRSKRDG